MPNEQLPNGSPDAQALQAQIADLQRRLQASETRVSVMRQVIDQLPAAVYVTGRNGVIALANRGFAEQWGRTPADFEGHALTELFPPETAALWQQNVDAVLSDGGTTSNEETYGEGEQARHYTSLRFPVTDASGAALGLGGISIDITERIRAETRYADTLQVLEGVVNNSPAAIYVKSPENRLMLVNQTYAMVIGRPVEELIGHTEDELFPAEMVASWRESDRQLFETGESMRFANSFTVGGETRDFVTVQFPLYDHEHQPYAICGIATDVTDIRRAEHERERLQSDIIQAQEAALRELSTPLIPLAEGIVVMPLVGTLDSRRTQEVMEVLLEGIVTHQAEVVLLDISGVKVVDTQVADALLRSARAVQLLGAQVVLTGISAEIAQTVVHLGADMSQIVTQANLQAGLRYALARYRSGPGQDSSGLSRLL